MHPITGTPRTYAWGSHEAINDLLGLPASIEPLAELWFGAHPAGPATLGEPRESIATLADLIRADPANTLGADVRSRFGDRLPYLLKLIAPASPLSLQVHPNSVQARAGFAREESGGVPLAAGHRNYRDPHHKPELVFALTRFEALCGFRAPRRIAELLGSLDVPLAHRLLTQLLAYPGAAGVRATFTSLLDGGRPAPEEIAELVKACDRRLASGSPSPRADAIVGRLARAYPGDPGAVASLLLNPVTLRPGEALYVPAGGVHAYLSGLAVEVMANSDNVLRAGLTAKHIDVPEVLNVVDYVAAPPIRLAAEKITAATRVFYAPVDDFELSVATLEAGAAEVLPGRGPRVLLCVDGAIEARTAAEGRSLARGEAVFVGAAEGAVTLTGAGVLVQADVP